MESAHHMTTLIIKVGHDLQQSRGECTKRIFLLCVCVSVALLPPEITAVNETRQAIYKSIFQIVDSIFLLSSDSCRDIVSILNAVSHLDIIYVEKNSYFCFCCHQIVCF